MGPLEAGGVRSANKEAAAGAGGPGAATVSGKTLVKKTAQLPMKKKMVAKPGRKQSPSGKKTAGSGAAKMTICGNGTT